ncbi:MAG: KGK domain-containing protein [Nostocaceae cyanobacterium]|nr:KGK domain-containing protein [Nostocaceae cyanobacterium]
MQDDNFQTIDCEVKDRDSVISFSTLIMLKLGELMTELKTTICFSTLDSLKDKLSHRGNLPIFRDRMEWLQKGMPCEILRTDGKGWKKGKIRIKVTLEFSPDEPEIEESPVINETESPLDELRRQINEVA